MKKKQEKNKRALRMQRLKWCRIIIQLLFFIMAPALFSQAFGGAKEFLAAMGRGEPFAWSAFTIRLVILCIVTILVGRFFCGWMCAFGALGDWIYQFSNFLHKKLGIKRRFEIPQKAHVVLQKLKYIVLAVMLLLCFLGENALITQYSPWTVFSLLTVGNFNLGNYVVAAVLMVLIVIGMAVQERFFCQYLCPMGAIFSLLPEIPFFKFNRKEENCIPNCQLCKKQCPVRMKLTKNSVQDGECIRCGRCAATCPRENIGLPVTDKKAAFREKTINS